jgi:hypothetical protein
MARTSLFAFVAGMLGCGSKAVDSEATVVRVEAKIVTLTGTLGAQESRNDVDKSGRNPKWQTTWNFTAETIENEHDLPLPDPLLVRGKDKDLEPSLGRLPKEGDRLTVVYRSGNPPSSFLWIAEARWVDTP